MMANVESLLGKGIHKNHRRTFFLLIFLSDL